MYEQKYKFHNPVKEGLVFRSENYVYYSAGNYAEKKTC